METLKTENNKFEVLIGCEPTGHYWFAFTKYISDHQKTFVMFNAFVVKKITELDNNSAKKTQEIPLSGSGTVTARNDEFRIGYDYYVTPVENP